MTDSRAVDNVFYKDRRLVTKLSFYYISDIVYIQGFNYDKLNVINLMVQFQSVRCSTNCSMACDG